MPWLLIIGSLGAFKLSEGSILWGLVTVMLLIFYGLAAYAFIHKPARDETLYKIPLFFLVTNVAILVAWIKYFRGGKSVVWNPSVR